MTVKDKSKAKKNKGGRPTKYTKAIVKYICKELSDGRSLRSICREEEKVPDVTTVMRWLSSMKKDGSFTYQEFRQQYARAREIWADQMFEEIFDIADDGENDWMTFETKSGDEGWKLNGEHVQRSRLRVDTRKWALGKLQPKKYGEKIEVDQTVKGEMTHTVKMVNVNFTNAKSTKSKKNNKK